MSEDLDRAVWKLGEGAARVTALVRVASYGLRLAAKRVGDLAAAESGFAGLRPKSAEEMAHLAEALETGDENLTESAVLALCAHFREFLRAALGMEAAPDLPETAAGVEALAGTPGALHGAPPLFSLFLALAATAVRGGGLDRRALAALGRDEVELAYPGGKMKLFREGDRIALTERQVAEMGDAVVAAARAIRARLGVA